MSQTRIVDEFVKLVSLDSPSFCEREMGDYMAARLKALGFAVEEDDTGEKLGGNCGNFYASLPGTLPGEPLMFCAHLDTVEPSRGKKAVVHEDGTITSVGDTVLGADDAAALAVLLEALQTIREQGIAHRAIELVLTVAEEAYCRGSEHFDTSRVRAREGYVLDLVGPIGEAAYQQPTLCTFELTVRGKSAHAGFSPEDGIHAVAAAAEAIASLQMGHIDEETTFNIGVISGGLAGNIVPDRCTVRGEARSYVHEKAVRHAQLAREAFERAAKKAGATVEYTQRCAGQAYQTPKSHPLINRFEQACHRAGVSPVLKRSFGGSDQNWFAHRGITGIVIATGMNRVHSCTEYTTADELRRAAAVVMSLMTSLE